MFSRRSVLGAAGGLVASDALAQPVQTGQTGASAVAPRMPPMRPLPSPPEPQGLISDFVVPLWPSGGVPGSEGVTVRRRVLDRGAGQLHNRYVLGVSQPLLEVFRPSNANGAAVILIPGGGYAVIAIDNEGVSGAHRLMQAGVTVFVLNYRLPGDGWAAGYDAPAQDLQRAIRLVRSRATEFGVHPDRVGVLGFSAGGHLAATALTRHDDSLYSPIDDADRASARPDFVGLGYAFLGVGSGPGQFHGPDREAKQSLNERVRPGQSPTFLFHAANDALVPVANSLTMFAALNAAGVPAELHVYQQGEHGFGYWLAPEHPAAHWPDAFDAWARRLGAYGT